MDSNYELIGRLQVTYWTILGLSGDDSIKRTKDDVTLMF